VLSAGFTKKVERLERAVTLVRMEKLSQFVLVACGILLVKSRSIS